MNNVAFSPCHIAALGASYPLRRSRAANVHLQGSYEDKSLNDRIGGGAIVNNRAVGEWTATLTGDWRDGLGVGGLTSWNTAYAAGRIRITPDAARAADDAGARTAGDYGKPAASLVRLQRSAERWSLYAAASRQWASKNLDSSEKMSLGGNLGVRAYSQGEAAGDSAYLFTLEARYGAGPELQLSGFVDACRSRINQNPFGVAANLRELSRAGFALAWRPLPELAVTASVSWRVAASARSADVERTPRVWAQVAKYF